MNSQSQWVHEDGADGSYQVSYSHRDNSRDQRMKRHAYERRSARPSAFNGIHRRRNKRLAV